jgi:hypothetical protein
MVTHKHILQLSIDLTKILDKLWSRYNITASDKTFGHIQVIKKLENELKIKKNESIIYVRNLNISIIFNNKNINLYFLTGW